jgi:membrane-associated phospholipid phosphatase
VNRIKGWWPEAALAIAFGLITLAAARGWTAGLDNAVRQFVLDHQNIVLEWICKGLNLFGQGFIVTWILGFGLSLWLLYRTRSWKVLLPWATAYVIEYVTLGPIKVWSERDAPSSVLPNRVEFFNDAAGYALSYPSGHVVNAIVWWGVIVMVASKLWGNLPTRLLRLLRIAPPIIVFCTTIYLNHHWLTDNLAAVAIGLLIDRIIHRLYR